MAETIPAMSNSPDDPEFPFIETSESKFYRNFLKKWRIFYPQSQPREETVEEEEEEEIVEEEEIKTEVMIEKESSKDQPKKIFDYKSKKYIEQF